MLFASIPSPGSGSLEIGPLTFRAYGVMIALGVLAAVWLVGRRLADRGISPDHASGLAMWTVPAGLVGARAYHVITDWRSFQGSWGDAFKIWEGGLGILGGVVAGALAGVFYFRRHGIALPTAFDVAAPALPLAQAIGRWGNWFNQELFGGPTDLPWGLEIDPEHRPAEFADSATFHPTFLYESLWSFGVVALVLAVERSGRLRPGRLMFAYTAAYSVGRLWIEAIRVDPASEIAGVRVNIWVFSIVLVLSAYFLFTGMRREAAEVDFDDDPDLEPDADPDADPDLAEDSDDDLDDDRVGDHNR